MGTNRVRGRPIFSRMADKDHRGNHFLPPVLGLVDRHSRLRKHSLTSKALAASVVEDYPHVVSWFRSIGMAECWSNGMVVSRI
jgi:hypothetical protein